MFLGSNIFMIEVNDITASKLINYLKNYHYKFSVLKTYKDDKEVLLITCPRKRTSDIIDIIREFDKHTNIISEDVKINKF